MSELSLGPLTILRATHREMVQAAAAGGFDAVGLRLIAPRPGDPIHPLVGDAAATRALRRQMDDAGLRLLDIEALWLGPDTQVATVRPALETAAELGGRYLLVAGNDPDWERMASHLAQVAQLAAEYGLKVGIEPISYGVVSKLQHAEALLRRSGAANAGILVDALHLHRAGETPAMLADVDPRLIAYAQICDASATVPGTPAELMAEARGGRLLPGEGVLPLAHLLSALPAGLPLGVEAPTREFAALPVDECARRAGRASRACLAAWEASRAAGSRPGA